MTTTTRQAMTSTSELVEDSRGLTKTRDAVMAVIGLIAGRQLPLAVIAAAKCMESIGVKNGQIDEKLNSLRQLACQVSTPFRAHELVVVTYALFTRCNSRIRHG